MKPIIRVENLSKQYRIGGQQTPYLTFRESIVEAVRSPFRGLRQNGINAKNSFWALKNVNFEAMPGEVVGIIGHNGAGKSTLLKILSRITEPTKGRIELYGRVGSLLEAGTGFHPELTGRENIFLNGAILGMRREEIAKKFDEIVDFAEIEKFLDTPVKHYSSGMYMRIAFAVAAHLDPEILIVDEILSVGDTKFQNKCLGKMQNIGKEGRTVLFVSHNIAMVRQLCHTGILLDKGSLCDSGPVDSVINQYFKKSEQLLSTKIVQSGIELVNINLINQKTGEITISPVFNQTYLLNLKIKSYQPLNDMALYFRLYNELGILISTISTCEEGVEPFSLNGVMNISFHLPNLQLFPGNYYLSLIVYRFNDRDYLDSDRCFSFEVQPATVLGSVWEYKKSDGAVRISDGCKIVH